MSALTLSAKLDRADSNTTWGFRMHGGKDFGCPLSIQRVTPGSLAHKCGLQVGDTIAKIGGAPTDALRHKEAQGIILRAGNSLELALIRGGPTRTAAPPPQQPYSAPPPAAPAAPAYQPPPAAPFSPSGQNYNAAPRPFPGSTGGTVPMAVNSQYNSPLSMYSVDNVMDSLSGQTRNLGVSGSEDGSSGTSTPPPLGGSMLHDATPPPSSCSPHAGGGYSSSPSSLTSRSASPGPTPPWKAGVADGRTRTASPTRLHEQRSPAPWRSPGETRSDPAPSGSPSGSRAPGDSAPPWKAPPVPRAGSPAGSRQEVTPTRAEDDPKWGYTNPHVQSKAFKILQTKLDPDTEVSSPYSPPTPGKPSVVHTQFNSPMGLYNNNNVREAYHDKSSGLASDASRPGMENSGAGTKLYRPSETFALVQKEDSLRGPLDGESVFRPAPVRAFTPASPASTATQPATATPGRLVNRGAAPAASPAAPVPRAAPAPAPVPAPAPAPARPAPSSGTWKPQVPTGPRKMRLGRAGEAKSMASSTATGRIPICTKCGIAIRGPFVLALEKEWCPDHFICSNPNCKVPLIGIGFVEEEGQVFCEKDYETYFAPTCNKCNKAIVGECVNALRNTYHPHCFLCVHCRQPIGSGSFHMEDGGAYCEKDWQAMFQTKCYGCQFPIEPGDRWVEALSQNWHSECFNCSTCQVNLEGQAFFAKSGRPYCKKHAMAGGGRF